MAPEERKRHRRHSAVNETDLDDANEASAISAEDLVHLTLQQILIPELSPSIDPGSELKIRHGTYDIHGDPRLSGRVQDFIGDIEVRRVRPAIQCPFHTTPVPSAHRVEVDPTVVGPNSARWGRLPKSELAEEATYECLTTICGTDLGLWPNEGRVYTYQYTFNRGKANTSLRNDDGAFAFIPQTGPVTLDTELGLIELRVGDIGVVPAGIHFSMAPANGTAAADVDGACAGYVLEVVGAGFELVADSDFVVASGPRSHEEGSPEEEGMVWTHYVKDSSSPRTLVIPSRLGNADSVPPWAPPNLPPHSTAAWRSRQQEEEDDKGNCGPFADGKRVNPIYQYTLAHGPLDVVAWEVEGSRCADLPYKVQLSVPPPDQNEPWPVLRADHGDGHVSNLYMFTGRAQATPWNAPSAAATAASSESSGRPDDAGVVSPQQLRQSLDGLNVAYGVIRGIESDDTWQGLHAGDLVVQTPETRDEAGLLLNLGAPDSETAQCPNLLGFLLTFPGKLGFTEWALSEHPAKISSTSA